MKPLACALLIFLALAGVGAAGAQPVTQLFVTSDRCMACHNGLVAPDGRDLSIGKDWTASMMANSARDPYWQASVRRETMQHPGASAKIQDKCASCHMPMNRYQAKAQGKLGRVFANLPVNPAAPQPAPGQLLAWDSVSCSMCHQITKDKLGSEESFTAGFVVDTATPLGRRPAFGPFDTDPGRQGIMSSASQLNPSQAKHIQDAALCGSCHTLYTHAIDPAGKVVGQLPEQVPYLEWRHSGFYGKRSCQSCHMPVQSESMPITSVLGQKREHFSRHSFRGGNFFMLGLLRQHAQVLGVTALAKELDASASRTRRHLESLAAKVDIVRAELSGGRLVARVRVSNLAGHKLPTAYPSRRAWINLAVSDSRGKKVFVSGALRPDGSIAGNDNDVDPAAYEPHYQSIDSPDKVQIYESIMAGPTGKVTTGLMEAVRFVKDNRILPQGFDKASAQADIAVRGRAAGDPDFSAGQDQVDYTVKVDPARGPFTLEARLWYQPIGFRWAQNLKQYNAAETKRFVSMYDAAASGSAMLLAKDTRRTP